MSLQTSYRYIAPFYDVILARATAKLRQRSLSRLPPSGGAHILLSGAGTGLDFPFLKAGLHYTAVDLMAAMIARSHNRVRELNLQWVQGDRMSLSFASEHFDYVVQHLIFALVSYPERCLVEAVRILKPGGKIFILDKFLHLGERVWLRRSLSGLVAKFATRLDVVFEEVLAKSPELNLISDEPVLPGGWFRLIELQKKE